MQVEIILQPIVVVSAVGVIAKYFITDKLNAVIDNQNKIIQSHRRDNKRYKILFRWLREHGYFDGFVWPDDEDEDEDSGIMPLGKTESSPMICILKTNKEPKRPVAGEVQ
jgi:hypothetical protein